MNLPPNIDPSTAYSDNDVAHWLTNDTRDKRRFIDNISLSFVLGSSRPAMLAVSP